MTNQTSHTQLGGAISSTFSFHLPQPSSARVQLLKTHLYFIIKPWLLKSNHCFFTAGRRGIKRLTTQASLVAQWLRIRLLM